MEERVDPADVTVEGPERDSPAFPLVGRDKTPTPADLAAGRHGNGSWDLTDASVEVAYQEVQEAKRAERDERRTFFHEKAKDALEDAVKLHHGIIRRGLAVMALIEADETVSAKDMQILAMAQKSSKELVDRANGRAATAAKDENTTRSFLSIIKAPKNDR